MMSVTEQNKFRLSSIITPEQVIIAPENTTKAGLIGLLVERVCASNPQLDGADILAQVLKREEGISTTLDTGLSLPHARLEEIDDFKAALAVIPGGISDPAHPDLSIKTMFLFLSPARQTFFQKHLQVLATLAETFKADFIEEISALPTAEAVASVLASK